MSHIAALKPNPAMKPSLLPNSHSLFLMRKTETLCFRAADGSAAGQQRDAHIEDLRAHGGPRRARHRRPHRHGWSSSLPSRARPRPLHTHTLPSLPQTLMRRSAIRPSTPQHRPEAKRPARRHTAPAPDPHPAFLVKERQVRLALDAEVAEGDSEKSLCSGCPEENAPITRLERRHMKRRADPCPDAAEPV